MKVKQSIISILLVFCFFVANAQETTPGEKSLFFQNTEFQIRAGFSIGGIAPIPLPIEIREIERYDPTLALGLEANLTKWLGENQKWGIRTGLRAEGRGMKTEARVKDYYTEVIGDGGQKVTGNFTGMVQTTVKNSYFSIPVLAIYDISKRWNLYGGFYFSTLIERNFSGYVYDGYLREGGSTGSKLIFEGDNKGPYDFSDDLRVFQWGAMAGGEFTLRKHLELFSELTWGLNDLFKNDFKTITFDMYSIYLNIGFGYRF
ncbi:MAG TPA: porin family protein [Bacteroidales bacterium]|nr:porin family protein [Bacteroidales bacterium]